MASYSNYPESARNNAKRALKWAEENGWGSCGTPVGKKRAADLAAGKPLSLKTVKRVYSFLSRHAENADVPYDEGCGGLMYDAWGGKSMLPWAKSIATKEDRDMEMNNKETRSFAVNMEVRDHDEDHKDGKKLSGYAIKYNDITNIGGRFEERVDPTALEGVDMRGVHALHNHNWDQPLGKEGLNMTLTPDEEGLRVDINLNNTSYANDLYENVRTGIVGGMSFGFTVADQDVDDEGDIPLRTITQIGNLYEVTFTSAPAYPTTEVFMRSLEAAIEEPVATETEAVVETVEVAAETTEEAPAVEEVPVVEEVTAEASEEVADATSAEESVESQPLATTKEEMEAFLASLLD